LIFEWVDSRIGMTRGGLGCQLESASDAASKADSPVRRCSIHLCSSAAPWEKASEEEVVHPAHCARPCRPAHDFRLSDRF
jgi:hypothetical protein